MRLRRLRLWDFRNYRRLDIAIPPGSTLIVGENAQGKSNLLEAVYLGATLRSPRAESDAELINRQAVLTSELPAARILLEVERRDGLVTIEVVIVGRHTRPRAGEGNLASLSVSKRVRVNGVAQRVSDAVAQMTAVLFTSQDLDLVTGSPALRRRYMDLTLAQLDRGYPRALTQYGRVLLHRNSLLRRIQAGEAREDELLFWDQELAKEGSYIALARLRMLALLAPLLREEHARLSAGRERLEVRYQPQLQELLAAEPRSFDRAAVIDIFQRAVAGARRREIGAGTSLVGPHRDDLVFLLDSLPAAAFASRAQQRTAALALRLAEARLIRERTGDPPVLLLDDILSELDRRRSASVIATIADYTQSLITAVELDRFPQPFLAQATVFAVQDGQLVPVNGADREQPPHGGTPQSGITDGCLPDE